VSGHQDFREGGNLPQTPEPGFLKRHGSTFGRSMFIAEALQESVKLIVDLLCKLLTEVFSAQRHIPAVFLACINRTMAVVR